MNNFSCNILDSYSALQAPGLLSSTTGTSNAGETAGSGSSAFAGAVTAAGDGVQRVPSMVSPLTFVQLGTSGTGHRSLAGVNITDAGVNIQDGFGLTGVNMVTNVYSDNRVVSSPPCPCNAALLLGSVATQIVGGDTAYCYDMTLSGTQNNTQSDTNVVLVTAWESIGVNAGWPSTNCSAAISTGAVTLTFVYPQLLYTIASQSAAYDSSGTPIAYAVFSKGGAVLCAYEILLTSAEAPSSATVDDSDALSNAAQLFPAVDYSSCSPTENVTWSGGFLGTLINAEDYYGYGATPCGQLDGVDCQSSFSKVYVNNNNAVLSGSLQLAPFTGNASLLMPSDPGDTCLWLYGSDVCDPGYPGGIPDDASQLFAHQIINRATLLMYNSGMGMTAQPAVSACTAGIANDIGSLTIFLALSTGVSAIAAGVGVDAFEPPGFIAHHRGLYRIFPILTFIVEAAFINVATFTYSIALGNTGKSTHVVSWSDVDRNADADYETIDVFVATTLTLNGRASFYGLQWAVLCLSILLSTAFVMYRWHFKPVTDFVKHVDDVGCAHSCGCKAGVRPGTLPSGDALGSNFSAGTLGSLGSHGGADKQQGLQLIVRRS